MKPLGAFFALAIFTLPFLATFTLLKIQKHDVRRSVKRHMIAGLDQNELVYLEFTPSEMREELRWEHSKEFEYRGEMYDVVEQESKGDTTFFWCWWDHEETKLNKQLNALTLLALGENPTEQNKQRSALALFKTMICFENESPANSISRSDKRAYPDYYLNFFGEYIELHSPPPENRF